MSKWQGSGPWTPDNVEAYLSKCRIPLRLGCTDGSGVPRIVSLWFEWDEGALCCAPQRDSAVVRWLEARPNVGFEVSADAPPYSGIRGTGVASLDVSRGGEQLRRLLDRYEVAEGASLRAALLKNENAEVRIQIQPVRIDSWDYTERMVGVR
jgi:hypothetical protein